MPARSRARRRALEVLYAAEVTGRPLLEVWQDEEAIDPRARANEYTGRLIGLVVADQARIDALIAAHALGWSVDRMPVVDRSILRLAVAELLDEPGVPVGVAIDEAVELASSLSTDDSPRFVNGVLAAIAGDLAVTGEPPVHRPAAGSAEQESSAADAQS
ncbi:MAG: transcription antitermination factor NusB [Actinomycetales bacterium]|nr:transcription antitermination factor NusB [Actinomycetales bacterium]